MAQEVDNTAYDQWLEQLSEDTKQYVRAVFKTLVATVPKAIIHSQARSLTLIRGWRCVLGRRADHMLTRTRCGFILQWAPSAQSDPE